MLRILTYGEINRDAWSDLVRTSATGTWFQSPEEYDFFASQPDLFTPFVVALEGEGSPSLRAICVGYVTKEKNALRQFFTRRAIIIGGPCLADDCTPEEAEALMKAVREWPNLNPSLEGRTSRRHTLPFREGQGVGFQPIYIETRNFNDYSQWREAFETAGFAYQPHLNFHIDTSSPDIVEANLGKSRKRDIRTTIREGVRIVELSDERLEAKGPTPDPSLKGREEQVREFYGILERLYRTKVRTPLFPLEFFLALSRHKDAHFLLTEYQGRIIGGTVCVEQAGKCLYEWFACGEDGVYPHIFPSCYATYAGIRYAAENGCPRFDMMGAGKPGEAYGVRDFKAKFGGKEVEHGRYMCILRPMLFKIGKIGVQILKHLKF